MSRLGELAAGMPNWLQVVVLGVMIFGLIGVVYVIAWRRWDRPSAADTAAFGAALGDAIDARATCAGGPFDEDCPVAELRQVEELCVVASLGVDLERDWGDVHWNRFDRVCNDWISLRNESEFLPLPPSAEELVALAAAARAAR